MAFGAARLHRQQFERYLQGAGVTVTVRQPPARSTGTAADRVLGKRETPDDVGVTQDVTVLWSTDLLGSGNPTHVIPQLISDLARDAKVDAILRTSLATALADPTDTMARTIFDTAKDVMYGGYSWQVTGTVRTGMPPEGPYTLWIAVKRIGA